MLELPALDRIASPAATGKKRRSLLPSVSVMPLASVMPLLACTLAASVRFEPMITVSRLASVPPSVLSGSVVTMVPPMMVPLLMADRPAPVAALRPPLPNTPSPLMSRIWPVLLSVPVRLTSPPVRVKVPSVGVEMLPPRLSTPLEMDRVPVLVPLAPVRL